MAMTPEEAEATMVANLAEKTGKTLEQWLKLASKCSATKHGELVKWLKEEHGMTHGYANLVAHRRFASAASDSAPEDLVEAQYAGKKAPLLPIYAALDAALKKLGKDVEAAPKKGYVSYRRSKQFALVQPSTATRIDVGIQLKGVAPTARLEASGSFNAMVSHRVRIESLADIDAELRGWLKQAYEGA